MRIDTHKKVVRFTKQAACQPENDAIVQGQGEPVFNTPKPIEIRDY